MFRVGTSSGQLKTGTSSICDNLTLCVAGLAAPSAVYDRYTIVWVFTAMNKQQLDNAWILILMGEAISRSASPCLTTTLRNLAHDTLMESTARTEEKSGGFNASPTVIRQTGASPTHLMPHPLPSECTALARFKIFSL